MRPDQIQRIKELTERLADRFLVEADPAEWPGDGKPPGDLTQQERGDAYWAKKNAMATGGVLRYTIDLVVKHQADDPRADEATMNADLDRQIKEAERRSRQLVDEAVARAKAKPEFDKRNHGL